MSPDGVWIVATVLFMIGLPAALVMFTERLRVAKAHLEHYQVVADAMRSVEGVQKAAPPPDGTRTVDPWGVWQDGQWHSVSDLTPTKVQPAWRDHVVDAEEAERRKLVQGFTEEDMAFFRMHSPELVNGWKKAGYINESEELYRGVQEL